LTHIFFIDKKVENIINIENIESTPYLLKPSKSKNILSILDQVFMIMTLSSVVVAGCLAIANFAGHQCLGLSIKERRLSHEEKITDRELCYFGGNGASKRGGHFWIAKKCFSHQRDG